MHPLRSSTAVIGSLVAVLATGASAAHADATSITDKRSDVVLDGRVGGDRTAEQKSVARGLDATSFRLNHGAKYVSLEVTFAHLQKPTGDLNYGASFVLTDGRSADEGGVRYLAHGAFTGDAPAFDVYDSEGGHLCGADSPSGIGLTPTTVYGTNGYVYVQMPRVCVDVVSRLRATATVAAHSPSAKDRYQEFVSSTKYKTAKRTAYVKP